MADDELTTTDVAIAMVLSAHGRIDGTNIFPSKETLARECKTSERTVYRSLKQLADRGYILDVSEVPRGQRGAKGLCTVYRLTLPAEASVHPIAPDTDGKAPATGGDTHLTPVADQQTMGNRPTSEHSDVSASGSTLRVEPAPDLDDWDYEDDLERIEHAVHGFEGCDERTALGMLSNGVHPKAVINKILAGRRAAA
ncbi:helix-turn-helix domain-containing protein [Saccharopolyspora taberi]